MTEFIPNPAAAAEWCQRQRNAGRTVGYVPTMGALHQGHLSLVSRSVADNDTSCVSIFINPLQFDNPEDLDKYPGDMMQDIGLLEAAGCDMVYTGTLGTFFPGVDSPADMVPVEPLPAIAGLEADSRPGHLEGVQAIVERLFATVGSCRAYFGEKDFQQTLLVRQIAALTGEVTVVVCPTVREESGLAMSSRNQRLGENDRQLAALLYQALGAAGRLWRTGERNPGPLEAAMKEVLDVSGIELEYAAIRDPLNWTAGTPRGPLQQGRALVAAWVGGVRLIDNLALE
jgi:pantoate--beta-alanine ligase